MFHLVQNVILKGCQSLEIFLANDDVRYQNQNQAHEDGNGNGVIDVLWIDSSIVKLSS